MGRKKNRWKDRRASRGASGWLAVATIMPLVVGFGEEGPVPAVPSREPEPEYRLDVWQTEDGLPQNSVTSITQTPDGYLWLGTFNGLVRFDGVEFTVFNPLNTPELRSSRIATVHADGAGRLWITSEFGDLTLREGGRFQVMNGRFGLPAGPAFQEAEDPDGWVWVWAGAAPTTRYYRLDRTQFVPAPDTVQAREEDTASLTADHLGRLWARRGTGWVTVARNTLTNLASFRAVEAGATRVVGPERGGGVWLGTAHGLWALRHGKWENHGTSPALLSGGTFVVEDRDDNKWLGTWTDGLWRIDRESGFRFFPLTSTRRPPAIRSALQDREGNLWFGTDGAGLYRLKRNTFLTYDSDHGLSADVVDAVTEDSHGTLWVLTQAGIDWIAPGPGSRPIHRFDLAVPWTAVGDSTGQMWVGTYGGEVYHYDGQTLAVCAREGDVRPKSCTVLFLDRRHTLWAGATDGLWRMGATKLQAVPKPPALKSMDVRAMAEDGSGGLWVGLNGGGLLRLESDRWQVISSPQGLTNDHIWSLYVDAADTLWIGTLGSGLSCRRDGKVFSFPARLGLPHSINCIVEDQVGSLWLGSNDGIYRVSRRQLDAWTAGRRDSVDVLRYNKTDGLGTSECNGGHQPTVWQDREGRIWFATVKGISVVDPEHLPANTNIPPVVIETVQVNGETKYPVENAAPAPPVGAAKDRGGANDPFDPVVNEADFIRPIIVPPGNQRLEIHYAALSFTAPNKVQFRYQLHPLDHEWTDAAGRRVAYYQGLPPGTYRFQVIASNSDGVWNTTGATLAFEVLPWFWQTRWFDLLVVAAVVGGAWWRLRLSLTRLTRQRAEQQAFSRRLIESQEQERKRIATELHDSLGQNLLIIKNRAVLALNHAKESPALPDQLGEISQVASQSLEAVREISHNLRPYQLDRLGLTKAIHAVVSQVSKSSAIAIRSDIDRVDGIFPPDLEINFYRIVQESLNNIVKHSQARGAHVRVECHDACIRLKIDDDGRGFDLSGDAGETPGRGGLGLTGLAERARILGGRLRIDSAPGCGTHVLIEIPMPDRTHEN